MSSSTMLSVSGPVAKRSRLSLKKSSNVSPFIKVERLGEGLLKQVLSKSDALVLKSNALFKSESDIADVAVKIEPCITQDENLSPNVSLSLAESSSQSSSKVELEQSEIINLIKDQSESFILGLPNCGNTCYCNSVLQVLRYTPTFLFSLHKLLVIYNRQKTLFPSDFQDDSEAIFFQRLHKLYIAMKKQDMLVMENPEEKFNYDDLLDPVESFLISLRNISPQFKEDEQHDAHEFLLTIISSFSLIAEKFQKHASCCMDTSLTLSTDSEISSTHEASPQPQQKTLRRRKGRRRPFSVKKKSKNPSMLGFLNRANEFCLSESMVGTCIVDSVNLDLVFEGKICQIVQCRECDQRQEREEMFSDIDVPIAAEDSSDSESSTILLTDCLSQSTSLKGENKYHCSNCLRFNEAKLSSEVTISPTVLMLHISWLSQTSEITDLEKSNTKIRIPLSLQNLQECELFSRVPKEKYKLYAIILHIGSSALGGHYVSFVKLSLKALQNVRDSPMNELNSLHEKALNIEIGKCCKTMEIKGDMSDDNSSWYLIDDEKVLSVDATGMDCFPYFDYLGATATPCMIFYQRVDESLEK